ncbi:MAG: hypothetical protein KY459_04915 [Acidobacteria bacterium]|nr:hypothetical protein [Acidobacteriota bacterium]
MAVVAGHASAASYVVTPDEYLIDRASSIVSGTVIDRWSRVAENGRIETVYRVLVSETLKGDPYGTIELREWGGVIGDRWEASSAARVYEPGRRYLIFLDRFADGRFTTLSSSRGRFEYQEGHASALSDPESVSLLEGGASETRPRGAEELERLVRRRLSEYRGMRQSSSLAKASGLGSLNVEEALDIALAAWNGPLVRYSAPRTPATSNTRDPFDGEDRIILGDPHDDLPGTFTGTGLVAVAFTGGRVLGGRLIIEGCDVIVQNGVTHENLKQTSFNTMIVHELGHSLGFRHSNTDRFGDPPCETGAPCSNIALMTSLLLGSLNGVLQAWDLDALGNNYAHSGIVHPEYLMYRTEGDGTYLMHRENPEAVWLVAACNSPEVAKPSSSSLRLTPGDSATLAVEERAGESVVWLASTANESELEEIGHGARVIVTPSVTTTYTAHVSNGCGATESESLTIEVASRWRPVNRR